MSLVNALAPEWERVDLLGACLSLARLGEGVPDDMKHRLSELQKKVNTLRANHQWLRFLNGTGMPIDFDVLACVLAPVAEPRLGWMYQELQPGVSAPYPTPALMRELFFMDGHETAMLYDRVSRRGHLFRSGLLEHRDGEAFQPLTPTGKAVSLLLGVEFHSTPPPGTIDATVPGDLRDLVLPEYCMRAVREYLSWVNCQGRVVHEWGGRVDGGPVALFSGPSGAGKTFAAAMIANELGRPLYRVDLGLLVSKYIGETEKNLNLLFEVADGMPMVLLFDEAESLFGKRGEIKEARDRYANMEVSHLLSRIERHRCPSILTTNLRKHLDPAFARRFQVVIDFSLPDASARVKLWRMYLPPHAPRDEDVDLGVLGQSLRMSGGQIRNVCTHAAVQAASEGTSISLRHITRAAWVELTKGGKEVLRSSLGVLAEHLGQECANADN